MIKLNRKPTRFVTLTFFSMILGVPNLSYSFETLSLPTQGCSFTGSFTQSKDVVGLADPLLSEGVFYYHCEAGVIWKTERPISQTLVFRKTGKAFSVQQPMVTSLKSAQGKILGRLLNSLIGGNQNELSEQFEISARDELSAEIDSSKANSARKLDTKRFSLKPRKRSLKRGLKVIELDLTQPVSGQSASVDIAMLGRKNQWTRINSIKTASLDNLDSQANPTQQCTGLGSLTKQECDLLYDAP